MGGQRRKRNWQGRVMVALALVGATATAVAATLRTVSGIRDMFTRRGLVMPISLNREDLSGIFPPGTLPRVEAQVNSYGQFLVTGLSQDLLNQFAVVAALNGGVMVLCSGAVIFLCVRILRNADIYRSLAVTTAVLGVVIGGGLTVSQWIAKNASDSVSAHILRRSSLWEEPGFLAGIDFAAAGIGVLFLIVAACLAAASRLADETKGMV